MHAPVMVELDGETDPLQLAMKELKYVLCALLKIPYIDTKFLKCLFLSKYKYGSLIVSH